MQGMFSPIIQKMLNDYAPLTAEEEKTATKDELVLHNIRYAATVVAEYTAKDRTDELMSAAIAGLQEAADRWDSKRGTKFITFAVWWIRQQIQRFFKEDRLIRIPDNIQSMDMQIRRHRIDLDEAVEGGWITESMGDRITQHRDLSNMASLDREREGQANWHEIIADETPRADAVTETRDTQEYLRDYIANTLKEREQDVIALYFGLGGDPPWTLEEISMKYGVTRERIRQIKEQALTKLRFPRRQEHRKMRAALTA